MSLAIRRQRRKEQQHKRKPQSTYTGNWTAAKQKRLIAILKREWENGWAR